MTTCVSIYPNNATSGQLPRRFPCPVSEAAANPTNYAAARAAVNGGDFLTGHMHWAN